MGVIGKWSKVVAFALEPAFYYLSIFDPTGNPVFQNETWHAGPIKCG